MGEGLGLFDWQLKVEVIIQLALISPAACWGAASLEMGTFRVSCLSHPAAPLPIISAGGPASYLRPGPLLAMVRPGKGFSNR